MSAAQPWLDMTIEERLTAGIDMSDTDACWLFTGTINKYGYGRICYQGYRNWPTHRLAHILFVGPIPAGMQVDHTCHNDSGCTAGRGCLHRRCLNPRHLEAVTPGANTLRSANTRAGRAVREGTCERGHEYTPENTYYQPSRPNVRHCRTCIRRRLRESAERRAGRAA